MKKRTMPTQCGKPQKNGPPQNTGQPKKKRPRVQNDSQKNASITKKMMISVPNSDGGGP